jgi:pyruvate dehydrogenase E2 component (dihydrolipoamide acetyltransferase)
METGILSEWYVSEGSSFVAGAALAKIETDKASMDFEAQDDGVIAKILMEAGGDDIPVGTPILVTVEEIEDLAAFKDFKLEAVAPEPAAPAPEPTPAPVVAAPVAPPTPAPAVVAAEPVAAPVAPPAMEDLVAAIAPVMSTGWGEFAKMNSPLAKTLSKQQQEYVEKYGTTGQVPL